MARLIHVRTKYLVDSSNDKPQVRINTLVSSCMWAVNVNIEPLWFPTIKSFEVKLVNDTDVPEHIFDAVVSTMKAHGYVFSVDAEEYIAPDVASGYRHFSQEQEYCDEHDALVRPGY